MKFEIPSAIFGISDATINIVAITINIGTITGTSIADRNDIIPLIAEAIAIHILPTIVDASFLSIAFNNLRKLVNIFFRKALIEAIIFCAGFGTIFL